MSPEAQFDRHADTYDADLNQALAASGEDRHYFAQGRVRWLAHCLTEDGFAARSVVDYGCGVGDTSAHLRELVGATSIVGLDLSPRSLELARANCGSDECQFFTFGEYLPSATADLVYCNGVFHHIPVAEREAAVDYIYRCLRPGGRFALWENNPWNPGTHWVMSHCVFDRDAVKIAPPEARRLMSAAGFKILSTTFLFLFPKVLKALRSLEPALSRLPLGAQYQVLCQKPG